MKRTWTPLSMYLKTPFYDLQKTHDAIFRNYDEFLFELPEHFGSAELEYKALKQSCACIDFSYYSNIKLTGKHAQGFLNRMSTNDLKKLNVNEFASTVLTNEKGRIIDLIVVYRQADALQLTSSPQNDEVVMKWLEKYIIMDDVTIQNLTGKTIQLGLIGPQSSEILFSITKVDPPEQNQFSQFVHAGFKILVAPSHQIDDGFILIADISARESLWNLVMSLGIRLCGMEAYAVARIEQKKPVLRRELTDKYNPLEAGLTHAVSFAKGCYIGQEVIARLDSYNKIQKHLVQLTARETIPPESKIFFDNKEIGTITSASYSFGKEQNMALGYVKTEFTGSSVTILVNASGHSIFAEFSP